MSAYGVSTILTKFKDNLPLTLLSPSGLSDSGLKELAKYLEKGAEQYGFTGAYWTHRRVGHVIHEEFKIKYEDKQAKYFFGCCSQRLLSLIPFSALLRKNT